MSPHSKLEAKAQQRIVDTVTGNRTTWLHFEIFILQSKSKKPRNQESVSDPNSFLLYFQFAVYQRRKQLNQTQVLYLQTLLFLCRHINQPLNFHDSLNYPFNWHFYYLLNWHLYSFLDYLLYRFWLKG